MDSEYGVLARLDISTAYVVFIGREQFSHLLFLVTGTYFAEQISNSHAFVLMVLHYGHGHQSSSPLLSRTSLV